MTHTPYRSALIRLIASFMQGIKDKGGIYDFAVQCDEENNTPAVIDRNELVARVFVKPTKTAEFIELNFVLTATGANFKEIFKTIEGDEARHDLDYDGGRRARMALEKARGRR